MMSFPLPSLIRYWRAGLLLAVGIAFTPGRARAECGDYITIHNAAPGSHHSQTTHNNLGERTPFKLPCHGPNCSRSPERQSPPFAPPVVVGSPVKEQAQHVTAIDNDGTSSSSFARDNTSFRPIDRASSVFHPPRLG